MMNISYYAVFFKEDNGYWLKFPDLPGCFSCGEDIEMAKEMGKEALELYLHGLNVNEIPKKTEPPYNDYRDEISSLIEVELEVLEGKLHSVKVIKKQ